MRAIPRLSLSCRGFSLVELSIVVAILSVVSALGLEAAANFVTRTSTSVSRDRLKVVDDAVARFFKAYGRLPCPAVRSTVPTNTSYGLEDCTISVLPTDGVNYTVLYGGGVMVGAVPFRALNLPMSYSIDGFNSKLNYVVTKNLTTAGGSTTQLGAFASSGGTAAQNGIGGIEVRTGVLAQPCNTGKCQVVADPSTSTGAAYFIFSSGADQRGAVSSLGATLNACNVYSSEKRVDTQNCVFGTNSVRTGMSVSTIGYDVFYDNRYNAGLNLVSYYDDVAVWRAKSQLW